MVSPPGPFNCSFQPRAGAKGIGLGQQKGECLMEYQNPQPSEVQRGQSPAAAPSAMPAAPPLTTAVPGFGRTVISESAVAKVAGIAARAVPGV